MSKPFGHSIRPLIAVLALGVSLALPQYAAAADYALLTPGAAHSLLLDIASAGERLVAVGERGHILYSDDQGASWVQAKVPTSVMLTRLWFADARRGWAVGHDGNILVSEDGGVHWELQRDGVSDQARINEERLARARETVQTLRAELAQQAGEAAQDKLEALEEAEYELDVARELMREPVFPPPLMAVWFADRERGWAAGAFGTLLRTRNGGRHWEDWGWKVENPDELHFNGVTGDSRGRIYLASEWGYVFRGTNGGESWQALETGYEGSFFGVLTNPATDSVFAYGLRGTIYRSTDGGDDWQELESRTRASLFGAAATEEGALVFVGQDSAAVLSRDDGDSFRELAAPGRRGLTGVAATDGRLFVTGDGGSEALAVAPRAGE
ncbi:hypothetical protein E4634_19920 [Mangrovimicrobium sediminis]|uniref:Photosynthesis system II assembly factor Ycf48/Hcf136-like domain-containing protein n=1 Tax=Mangrovimicrobium sediminis TaxID=2562682 RepID=A0A4Z0LUX2_9GAMM|nr:YCF48-related protein [Haliea sp. SAOS-164]TGD71112.1 hypothetical protein E4634_19920 [Haliea sp. SAOS-164]